MRAIVDALADVQLRSAASMTEGVRVAVATLLKLVAGNKCIAYTEIAFSGIAIRGQGEIGACVLQHFIVSDTRRLTGEGFARQVGFRGGNVCA
ncbi:hypothetical protein D3C85_798210 [compost metagenome]